MSASATQITAIYQTLYGRSPTQAELNSAAAVEQNFGGGALIDSVVQSAETQQYVVPVWLIITFATGKQPIAQQISNWVNYLQSRVSELTGNGMLPTPAFVQARTEMANACGDSDLFQSRYGVFGSAAITPLVAGKIIANTQNDGTPLSSSQEHAANVWGNSELTVAQVFAQFATNDVSRAANGSKIHLYLNDVTTDAAATHASAEFGRLVRVFRDDAGGEDAIYIVAQEDIEDATRAIKSHVGGAARTIEAIGRASPGLLRAVGLARGEFMLTSPS
jgi:hypothetical protein